MLTIEDVPLQVEHVRNLRPFRLGPFSQIQPRNYESETCQEIATGDMVEINVQPSFVAIFGGSEADRRDFRIAEIHHPSQLRGYFFGTSDAGRTMARIAGSSS